MGEHETSPAEATELQRYRNNYRADFLWPFESGALNEAAYEFCNAATEEYREEWWVILKARRGK